jgi:hypothetical protein
MITISLLQAPAQGLGDDKRLDRRTLSIFIVGRASRTYDRLASGHVLEDLER